MAIGWLKRDWLTEFWLRHHQGRWVRKHPEAFAMTFTVSPDPYAWYGAGELIDSAPLGSGALVIKQIA